jgi:hypothetical protein
MAGVVIRYDGNWSAKRMLRDDVLDCLFGKAAANPRRLIDDALDHCLELARAGGVEAISQLREPILGLYPGVLRCTEAVSVGDALRQAVLLYASMAQLDGWDEVEESDSPAPEEVNKRFATEVREAVIAVRPDLGRHFGQSARLVTGGRPVKFGYLSDTAVLHFSVLHPVRQAASVRDARARLWELSRARELAELNRAALVTWVPTDDDPTVGARQRTALRDNKDEIEREADSVKMRLHAVASIDEARARVLETVG